MAGLIGIGRKKKAFADEANAKSTALKHKMAKSRAELAAQDYANEQQTKGTVVGAVGPVAGMAAYDYAKEEGLLGAEAAVGEAPVNGLDYSNMTTDKSAIEGAMHQADYGTGAIPQGVDPSVATQGHSYAQSKQGLEAAMRAQDGASAHYTPHVVTPAKDAAVATAAPAKGTAVGATASAPASGVTPTAIPAGQAAVGPAGAAPAASGAATAGVGLVGAAGAFGGKALASEVSDDPVVQGVGSVGGGVAAGAAAGAMVGGVGAPIGAAIGGIAGLLGAF
jgi:hypothetical protein